MFIEYNFIKKTNNIIGVLVYVCMHLYKVEGLSFLYQYSY